MPKVPSGCWRYFNKSVINNKTVGECSFCKKARYSNNATRMSKHLSTCSKCPIHIRQTFKDLHKLHASRSEQSEEEEAEEIGLTRLESADTVGGGLSITSSSMQVVRRLQQTTLMPTPLQKKSFLDVMTPEEQQEIERDVARAVYASDTPLSFTENKYWKQAFFKMRPAFKPPSRYRLSHSLLDEEYKKVQNIVLEKIAHAESMTLMSDGWTDIQGNPLVNLVLTTPQPVFLRAIETNSESHTGEYMAKIFIDVIEEVGVEKVHGLVTDNAANMKAAWNIVQKRFPDMIIYGCLAHSLNLLAKDICKLKTVDTLVARVKQIVAFFKNKHIPKQVLKAVQIEDGGKEIALLYPVETRWGSVSACLKSILKTKHHLQAAATNRQVRSAIPVHMRNYILDDDVFWVQAQGVFNLLNPISEAILKLEGDTSKMSDVFPIFHNMKQFYDDYSLASPLTTAEEGNLMSIFEKRRSFCYHPIQLAAYLLDPKYCGEHLDEDEHMTAMDLIVEIATNMPNIDENIVTSDLALYKAKEKLWSQDRTSLWKAAEITAPETWWKGLCGTRQLSQVAARVLSFPPSAGPCERNWKCFSTIKTKKRNRLTLARTAKLVSVHYNLSLCEQEWGNEVNNSVPNMQALASPSSNRGNGVPSASAPGSPADDDSNANPSGSEDENPCNNIDFEIDV